MNGEIWSADDAQQATLESGCNDIMLGRAAMMCPDIACQIQAGESYKARSWPEVVAIMADYLNRTENKHEMFVSNRAKQWLVFLQMHYPQAKTLFQSVKRMRDRRDVFTALDHYLTR